MTIIEQARHVVAERVIIAQRREIEALRLQREIAAKRSAVLTFAARPDTAIFALLAIYMALSFGLEYFTSRKNKNA